MLAWPISLVDYLADIWHWDRDIDSTISQAIALEKDFVQQINRHIYWHGLVYIPPHSPSRKHILSLYYDSPVARHPRKHKTLKLIKQYFWWPQLSHNVSQYVASCHSCQQAKVIHDA